MKSETSGQEQRSSWKSLWLLNKNRWWLFCLAIVLLKLFFFAIDPAPRFLPGESLPYIWSGINGTIPEGLSSFYCWIVRWVCIWAHSLTPLILFQTLLGAAVALAVAWMCRSMLLCSEWQCYLVGFLAGIDPLQLNAERLIAPDAFSLVLYASVLCQSFIYLRSRRAATLIVIQLMSVLTIAFRTIFVVPLQIWAALLPAIAFAFASGPNPEADVTAGRPSSHRRPVFWRHLVISLTAMLVLHQGYRQANGLLSRQQPAYSSDTGYFLLSAWAPAIRPEDAPDPRLAELISHGSEFNLPNLASRYAQRFVPRHLIDRWRGVETDRKKSRAIALRTAINALGRDPWAIIKIGAKTYYAFWTGRAMERLAKLELSRAKINERQRQSLLDRYHWRAPADLDAEPRTILTWYYTAAVPYYFAILLSPLLPLALVFVAAEKRSALLLFAHTWLIFCATFLLTLAPMIRYLEPLSVLMLLSAALALKSLYAASSDVSTEFQRGCAEAG